MAQKDGWYSTVNHIIHRYCKYNGIAEYTVAIFFWLFNGNYL